MKILQATHYLSDVVNEEIVPFGKRIYLQERLKGRFYEVMVDAFQKARDEKGCTRKQLAKRIGKRPEQITRLLNSPSDIRISTLSDILVGCAYDIDISLVPLERPKRNQRRTEWLAERQQDKNVFQEFKSPTRPAQNPKDFFNFADVVPGNRQVPNTIKQYYGDVDA